MDAVTVWAFSVWLSIHLSLTEMELTKWQALHVCVCVCVCVCTHVYWGLLKMVSDLLPGGGQGAADDYLAYVCVCVSVSTCASTPNPYHVSHARHVFPTNLCTHPNSEAHANRSERCTFPKEALPVENERPPALGQEASLCPALTSTVGASTPDPVHLIPPMMSKG